MTGQELFDGLSSISVVMAQMELLQDMSTRLLFGEGCDR
jgi:hypothetical protein